MHIEDLRKYERIYKSSRLRGSARILREYLGFDKTFPIPLAISHGVDAGQAYTAGDISNPEPIHWSYNELIHERALSAKPSIRLPHPWLMLKASNPPKLGNGMLVIGPPPGPSNDAGLLSCLKDMGIESYDLLLKPRGNIEPSRDFWHKNGISVVSGGDADIFFYDRLFRLIENYEFIIGGTLSSALFFAAAIGKKCKIIKNYTCSFYDCADYLEIVDFTSAVTRKFAQLLHSENYGEASTMAEAVLGKAFMAPRLDMTKELISAIEALKEPAYFNPKLSLAERKVVLAISKWTGRTSLLNHGVLGYFHLRLNSRVKIITLNEIDIWLNGLNEENFHSEEIEYIKGVTEPGWAVNG
jgi:hypothetical protein